MAPSAGPSFLSQPYFYVGCAAAEQKLPRHSASVAAAAGADSVVAEVVIVVVVVGFSGSSHEE